MVAVYITTLIETAEFYASRIPGGVVYEVEPEGEIAPDPVNVRTFARLGREAEGMAPRDWCCRRARIVEVIETLSPEASAEIAAELDLPSPPALGLARTSSSAAALAGRSSG